MAEVRTGAQDPRTKSHGIMGQMFIQMLQQLSRRLNEGPRPLFRNS